MADRTGKTIIQGKVVASKEEAFFANSLGKYAWVYEYQVPFFGGHHIAGGTVVDFIVSTVPLRTATWIQSDYWHEGAQLERDRLLQALIASKFKDLTILEVWGKDLTDQETSDKTVLHLFGSNR